MYCNSTPAWKPYRKVLLMCQVMPWYLFVSEEQPPPPPSFGWLLLSSRSSCNSSCSAVVLNLHSSLKCKRLQSQTKGSRIAQISQRSVVPRRVLSPSSISKPLFCLSHQLYETHRTNWETPVIPGSRPNKCPMKGLKEWASKWPVVRLRRNTRPAAHSGIFL